MEKLITLDILCAAFLGVALVIAIFTGYNENLACTIAGSLGGAITGYKVKEYEQYRNNK